MMRFFGLMLKLPVTVFVSGMEILVRSMQDVQRSFEKGVDDMVREFVGYSEANSDEAGRSSIEAKVAEEDPGGPDTIQPSRVEEKKMYDDGDSCEPDLSGDDVKTVGYWITFQKPDFETTLQARQDETIDYSTTAGTFAGLKLMDFINRLEKVGIYYPSSWDDKPPDSGYTVEWPGNDQTKRPIRLKSIPAKDRRFIDVKVVLAFRRPRQDAQYEKQKVEILRQIRDNVKPREGS
jgi:hypothetical protein